LRARESSLSGNSKTGRVHFIQFFVNNDEINHFSDFARFVEAYNRQAIKETPLLLATKYTMQIYTMDSFALKLSYRQKILSASLLYFKFELVI